jgi:hypothetical protein
VNDKGEYMFRVGLVALAAAMATPAAVADDVTSVVKACVEVVHSLGHTGFDAFYNPANKTVQNNALNFPFGREWLFPFQKCMAEHGFPLR